jgi:hypothetical protein
MSTCRKTPVKTINLEMNLSRWCGATMESFTIQAKSGTRLYWRRALDALEMEMIEEDVFQTNTSMDNPFNEFVSGRSHKPAMDQGSHERQLTRRVVRQLQQIAQDMGVLGRGSQGEPPRRGTEDYFPELLELKWPPDSRLVERDCTCDMWDRIRCKSVVYRTRLVALR